MVEGLRISPPLIKFRRVLPAAAVLFVALTTWLYFAAEPHTVRTPRGGVFLVSRHTRPAVIATAINLPAFLFALPVELAVFGSDARTNPYYESFRTIEFTLMGIIFWFIAGRAIDDWIAWRKLRSGSRWRLSDCLLAGLIAVESTMLAVLFTVGFRWSSAELWYLASALGWALLGYWAFIFRVVQIRSYPKGKRRPG